MAVLTDARPGEEPDAEVVRLNRSEPAGDVGVRGACAHHGPEGVAVQGLFHPGPSGRGIGREARVAGCRVERRPAADEGCETACRPVDRPDGCIRGCRSDAAGGDRSSLLLGRGTGKGEELILGKRKRRAKAPRSRRQAELRQRFALFRLGSQRFDVTNERQVGRIRVEIGNVGRIEGPRDVELQFVPGRFDDRGELRGNAVGEPAIAVVADIDREVQVQVREILDHIDREDLARLQGCKDVVPDEIAG